MKPKTAFGVLLKTLISITLTLAGAGLLFISIWLLTDNIQFEFIVYQVRVHIADSPKIGLVAGILATNVGIAVAFLPITSKHKIKMAAIVVLLLVFAIATIGLAYKEYRGFVRVDEQFEDTGELNDNRRQKYIDKILASLAMIKEEGILLLEHGKYPNPKDEDDKSDRDRRSDDSLDETSSHTDRDKREAEEDRNLRVLDYELFRKFKTQLTAMVAVSAVSAALEIVALIMVMLLKRDDLSIGEVGPPLEGNEYSETARYSPGEDVSLVKLKV